MKRRLAAHPVAAFILLAFGVSYLLGVPWLIFASGAIPPHPTLLHSYGPRLFIVYGPAIAALVLASVAGPGVRVLLSKLMPTWSDIALAAAVVAVGTMAAIAGLLGAGVGAAELWSTVREHPGLLLAHFLLQLFCIATGEEVGWRGWLLPALARRANRIRATLITAVVWTLWHGPRLFDRPSAVVMFFASVVALSFLFTWLWSRAGHRLFPVIVAHAIVNAPMSFWEQAGTLGPDQMARAWMIAHSVDAAIAVAVVLVGWRWWTADEPEPVSLRI